VSAELVAETGRGNVVAWLQETDLEIEERREFHEEEITGLCRIARQEIEIHGEPGYSPIEVMVSMNKLLHQTLFPGLPGKWLFTRVELLRPLSSRDASQLRLRFQQSFGDNKVTRAGVWAAGEKIGQIYFSLLKV
jgi:hypothetical protein